MSTSYENCLRTLAWFKHPAQPVVIVSGPDRVAFFQRQTTNDLNRLRPGEPVVSVLTDASGRILDVLEIMDLGSDRLGIRTVCAPPEERLAYFQTRIFFNDKIEFQISEERYLALDIEGPDALRHLEDLGFRPLSSVAPGAALAVPVMMGDMQAYLKPGIGAPQGIRIIGARPVTARLAGILATSSQALTLEEWQSLRIESAQATAPNELNPGYTPLEVGLDWAIAEDKGCYTGQEVLARQKTYGKVTRALATIQSTVELAKGVGLDSGGRRVGIVSSTCQSPEFGFIGLAVVRKPFDQPDSRLRVSGHSDREVVVARLRARDASPANL